MLEGWKPTQPAPRCLDMAEQRWNTGSQIPALLHILSKDYNDPVGTYSHKEDSWSTQKDSQDGRGELSRAHLYQKQRDAY